ncbi:MAG: PKD domain-containing protein [Saprospiraceae bacterium]|nr:PKD domain-containing protein [Saprospiraceae bacterium]
MVLKQNSVFAFILFLFITFTLKSQVGLSALQNKFRHYTILDLNAAALTSDLSSQRSDQKQVRIDRWEMTLFNSGIISPNYSVRHATPEGIVVSAATTALPMNGYTRTGGKVSLTFNENFIYGFVEDGTQTYFIEPLYHHTRESSHNQFIVYSLSDIIDDEVHTCGTAAIQKSDHHFNHPENETGTRVGQCYEVPYAIASDYMMFQDYGSAVGAENHAIGVLNNVQNNYDNEFADEIQFVIVEQFVSTCATCDPWSPTTDAEALLNEFTDWAPSGFNQSHAIGSIWTDRNFDGQTIGIAWVGAVCTPIQYNALEDFSSNANLKRVMVAHEFGHNFDANHDAAGSPYIMAPSVQNTSTWSVDSKNDIENYYASAGCLGSCGSSNGPTAGFTSTVLNECAPGQVKFTDQSSGNITSRIWQFEGGTPATSTQANPTIAYMSPGTYNVTLTVFSGSLSNTIIKQDEVTILPIPDADFDFSVSGRTVTFSNTSQNTTSAFYFWVFGDGITSSQENPVHTYAEDGTYSVTLSVDNFCGFDTRTKTFVIATPPTANFMATPTTGCGTTVVSFTNTSSTNATSYSWQFPGGTPGTSNLPNPVVTYDVQGIFPVTLTAFNAQGNDTKTSPNFITIVGVPTSAFSFSQSGLTYNFLNQATNATSFLWNFGDGNTSTAPNPSHTYTSTGNYTVTLTTFNAGCPEAISSQNINATTAPVAAFSASATTGCAPMSVDFFNNSINNPTAYFWNFPGGNPATSTLQNPTVAYNNAGLYDASLIVFNSLGSDTITFTNYVQVNDTPSPSFSAAANQLSFSFTHTGTGATSYLWNFGDGNSSTLENPNHSYLAEGNYTVVLVTTNDCGSDTISQTFSALLPPTANIGAATNQVCAGNSLSFQDQSGGTVQSRLWIFEGGNPATSTDNTVSVNYQQSGTFDVTLIASNSAGSDTITLIDYVIVNSLPTASFTFGINGSQIDAANTSLNANTVQWTLPDGNNSSQNNVSYVAPANGSYTFVLRADNPCGSVTENQTITFTGYPESNFTSAAGGTAICAPADVQYQAAAQSGATYTWTFDGGNPSTSSDVSPVIFYASSGNYDVSLIVTNALGADTTTIQHFIQLIDEPVADFDHTVSAGSVDFLYSGNVNDDVFWDFAGLGTSIVFNPSFTFPASGTYPVSLSFPIYVVTTRSFKM